MTGDRPNFLFFMPDQLRADAVGAFGSPIAKTPNIDALVARGTRFTQAFAQHSVCSPSRVSMLTGWYPHVSGHRTLTNLIKPWEPNLLAYLRDAGYHVAWLSRRGDTFAPGVTESSVDEYGWADPPARLGRIAPADFADPALARAFYRGRRDADAGSGVTLDDDEATTRSALQWLADPAAEPWLLFVTLTYPHPPFYVEEPWYSLHDRSAVPPPRPRPSGPVARYVDAIHERYGLGRVSDEQWREIAAVYHGMVSRVDWQLGRVLEALDRSGASERTVVAFFSDHGEYLGDYGLVEKWPSGLHDCLVREPLVMAGPGIAEGNVADGLVEMVDLLPTVLELAGVQARHTHFGRSLVPLLGDGTLPHRRAVFSEGGFALGEEPLCEAGGFPYDLKGAIQHEEPASVGRVVAMRTEEWTYLYRLYESDELYDRRDDPDELVNRIDDPSLGGVVTALREVLLAWMVDTADVIAWDPDPRSPPVEDRSFAAWRDRPGRPAPVRPGPAGRQV